MTQQLSNCCKAQVTVDSSDEGTSCFVCSGCKKACDLFEEMFVIDECREFIYCKNHNINMPIACKDTLNQLQRLKRLDENRKKLIEIIQEKKKSNIDNDKSINAYSLKVALEILEENLEGLDK